MSLLDRIFYILSAFTFFIIIYLSIKTAKTAKARGAYIYTNNKKEIQLLYCKWCPIEEQDCTLGIGDRLGCLASGGFADEIETLFKYKVKSKEVM